MENLWLDLRPVGEARLEKQFPTILGRCRALGLEPTTAPIPVAPAAHYWMGGVGTDLEAATSLPGLYAVGEVASTGVHGANRLASNSLMECLVFARRLRGIRLEAAPEAGGVSAETSRSLELEGPDPAALEAATANLRQLCWQVAGVERRGADLGRALVEVRQRRGQVEADPLLQGALGPAPGERITIAGACRPSLLALQDLHQRLVLAELLIEAAGFRAESRGGHHRTDAPAPQPFWRRHSLQRRGEPISTRAVGDQGVGTGPL